MKLTPTISSLINSYSRNRVSICRLGKKSTHDGGILASDCEHCNVRHKMQRKYLNEAHELYDEFFHIVQLPLLTEEVRGPQKLKEFSMMLVQPYIPQQ